MAYGTYDGPEEQTGAVELTEPPGWMTAVAERVDKERAAWGAERADLMKQIDTLRSDLAAAEHYARRILNTPQGKAQRPY